MRTLQIHLTVNNQPTIIEMVEPKISRKQFPTDAYGQAPINRVLIANDTQVACVSVDPSLDWRSLRSVADQYRRKKPEALRLGGRIWAIHYIEAGQGWPNDRQSEPVSILNCLPDDQWPLLASKPGLTKHHPLLHQPPGTIAFQGLVSAGRPVVINSDSISWVGLSGNQLRLTIKGTAKGELLGCGVIKLRSERATKSLAKALRNRQVRRVSRNETVESVLLLPSLKWCKGKELRDYAEAEWSIDRGLEGLWQNAQRIRPDQLLEIWSTRVAG